MAKKKDSSTTVKVRALVAMSNGQPINVLTKPLAIGEIMEVVPDAENKQELENLQKHKYIEIVEDAPA